MSLLQRVHDYLSSERKASTAELVRWVQEPSLAGAETGVQQQVVDALKALKMEVKMEYIDSEEIAKDPNFLSPRREFDTSPNVVGILKGSDPKNGKSLYALYYSSRMAYSLVLNRPIQDHQRPSRCRARG